MNILDPIFLSHVVLRFSPSDLPEVLNKFHSTLHKFPTTLKPLFLYIFLLCLDPLQLSTFVEEEAHFMITNLLK
jgi:hypothetical protein